MYLHISLHLIAWPNVLSLYLSPLNTSCLPLISALATFSNWLILLGAPTLWTLPISCVKIFQVPPSLLLALLEGPRFVL